MSSLYWIGAQGISQHGICIHHLKYVISKHFVSDIKNSFCEIALSYLPMVLIDDVNIGSGNGLMPSSNNPLPELMLTVDVFMWPLGHNELLCHVSSGNV